VDAAIRTEDLRRTYGQVRALDGLSLTVERGTVFGFVGPNGAGKTTTLRILAGLARPTSGRAWVAGLDVVADRDALAWRIGYLPEEPAFYPWLTPREFLDHVARLFGLDSGERTKRVAELLDLVGLTDVSRRRIGGFSRGMRQRLGIAQALVNRPEVLLLDEPASALDPAGRREVLGLVDELRGQCTVFMSTHILADVERVCDRVAIVAQGRLVTCGGRDELLERYALPSFAVEVEPAMAGALASWAQGLNHLSWVTGVRVDGATARVDVADVAEAKRALLPSAVQAGLVLLRYELVRPSLEDIFLRLVRDARSATVNGSPADAGKADRSAT